MGFLSVWVRNSIIVFLTLLPFYLSTVRFLQERGGGNMKTNVGGKLIISADLTNGKSQKVVIEKI